MRHVYRSSLILQSLIIMTVSYASSPTYANPAAVIRAISSAGKTATAGRYILPEAGNALRQGTALGTNMARGTVLVGGTVIGIRDVLGDESIYEGDGSIHDENRLLKLWNLNKTTKTCIEMLTKFGYGIDTAQLRCVTQSGLFKTRIVNANRAKDQTPGVLSKTEKEDAPLLEKNQPKISKELTAGGVPYAKACQDAFTVSER